MRGNETVTACVLVIIGFLLMFTSVSRPNWNYVSSHNVGIWNGCFGGGCNDYGYYFWTGANELRMVRSFASLALLLGFIAAIMVVTILIDNCHIHNQHEIFWGCGIISGILMILTCIIWYAWVSNHNLANSFYLALLGGVLMLIGAGMDYHGNHRY